MNCTEVCTRLPAWLAGDLPADEMSQLNAHLADCPSCRQEQTALIEVRRLLDAVPTPAVAVDLARLYRDAAERQRRRLRRWRRLACASVAAAAVLLLALLLARMEVRLDGHQLVVRWGGDPAPEQPTPPAPTPQVVERVVAAPSPATVEIEQQLRLLTELVQALSHDADLHAERRQQEMSRLRNEVQGLQQQLTQLRLATEKDVAALYAAQFSDKQKGDSR